MVGERLDAPQEDEEAEEEEEERAAAGGQTDQGGQRGEGTWTLLYAAGARGTRRVPRLPPSLFVLCPLENLPSKLFTTVSGSSLPVILNPLFPNRVVRLSFDSNLALG